MKHSPRLTKETLFIFIATSIFILSTDGRRYDKCETPDGRQGVCVVKKYCREATIHSLEACDDDENFCCPITNSPRSSKPPGNPVQKPRNTYVPKAIPSSGHKSESHDVNKENQRPVHSRTKPVEVPLPNIPIPEVLPPSNRRPGYVPHNFPTKPAGNPLPNLHVTANEDLPTSSSERRPGYVAQHFPTKPVENKSPNIPISSHEDAPQSSSGRKPEYVPQHFPSKSDENPLPIIPVPSHEDSPRLSSGRRPEYVPQYFPELQPDIKDNKKRTVSSSPSDSTSDVSGKEGRVKFEGTDLFFDDRLNNNRRTKPQSSYDDSITTSNNRKNPAGPDSVNNNRSVDTNPTVQRYPSTHELEIQKLPSNPRRLRPSHNDGQNHTYDEAIRHMFYPHSVPKVPACGVKPYDLMIIGGETSGAHEWPWMTAIFRRYQGSRPKTFLCGGSLINTKYVLTAAHCLVYNYVVLPASSFVVRLGSNFLDTGEEYTVAELIIHHNHSGADFFNDIALVKIASEVYITDKIAPICLPSPDMMSNDFVERRATVAGWGDTSFRTGSSRALQHVTMPIVSNEECLAAYSNVRGAAFLARGTDHVICAGVREGGKDACLGDSGGPLMLKTLDDRWVIVGIVSLGYKCAEPGYPGVYTRVTHYLTWINENMKPY